MKRFLVILLALVLVLSLTLVGCKTSNQQASEPAEQKTEKKTEENTKEKKEDKQAVKETKSEEENKDTGEEKKNLASPEKTGKEPPPLQKEPPIKLGFCPTAMDTFYDIVIAGAKEQIDEYGGKSYIDMQIQAPSSQSGAAEAVNIIETWLQKDIDAIALAISNENAVEPLMRQAAEEGIPMFIFNTPVQMTTNPYFVSNVGYNQYEAGLLQGKWVAEEFKNQDNVKIAVLEGLPGIHNEQRYSGFKDGIKGNDNLNIVVSQPADWTRARGQAVTENILVSNPDIDVLVGFYDEMLLGGISAIKAKGLMDQITVVGYDNTKDGNASIKRGEMAATVDTAPKDMGRNVIKAVKKYVIDGEMVPKTINSKLTMYDASNIDEFDMTEYEYVKK